MAKEYQIFKKNKNKLPSKKALNLYYKEDKTTRPSTIALYVLFILVVLLAVGKVAVYDKVMELEEARNALAVKQEHLDEQMAYLAEYKEVSSQYSRYSFSYLKSEEKVCDRIEILNMLENTVFEESQMESVIITENVVSLSFTGLNLEQTAWLAKKIEAYEIVESVAVNTATLNTYKEEDETLVTKMVINLVSEETEEAGGEQ